ncbi:MAG: glycosyltransferase family 4 protein [Solirubrobacteraceae bacterium]
MTRVLVVCAEPIGVRMAGPAIRARELARALAGEFDVTVAAPAPTELGDGRLQLVEAGFEDYEPLAAAVAAADVVVAQALPPRLLSRLPKLGTRLVADLYNPSPLEVLEAGRDRPPASRRRQQAIVGRSAVAHCAAADRIVCASEKQRDLWLGLMAGQDLIDLEAYGEDPTFRSVIDVVPFGMPAEPPQAGAGVLKGVWPGIAPDDKVVLWGGGIWNWLDPGTAIEAAARLEARRTGGPRTHLVFLGVDRPAIAPVDAMSSSERAIALARRLGVEGEVVHFNRDWVPYGERGAWLLEADLGISAHHDHLESRFSFRTRVLDYLWAGLPVVATRGDTLADLVAAHGIGLAVPPEDPDAFADAIAALLGDAEARAQAVAAIGRLAPSLTWEAAARPLAEFCRRPARPLTRPRRRALAQATAGQYPRLLAETGARLGPAGAARQVARNLRRAAARR